MLLNYVAITSSQQFFHYSHRNHKVVPFLHGTSSARWIPHLLHIWKVFSSNLGQATNFLDVSNSFLQSQARKSTSRYAIFSSLPAPHRIIIILTIISKACWLLKLMQRRYITNSNNNSYLCVIVIQEATFYMAVLPFLFQKTNVLSAQNDPMHLGLWSSYSVVI
jgi:hypothetical protein